VADLHIITGAPCAGWAGGRIEDAVRDARELRLVVGREFSSDGGAVETAAAVAHWILDDPHADRW
jgi:hypothetical protein